MAMKKADLATPYGLDSLVKAAGPLIEENILGDVTDIVNQLSSVHQGNSIWTRFVSHPEYLDPGLRVGMLDFSYYDGPWESSKSNAISQVQLERLRLSFLVRQLAVVDGQIVETDQELARIEMRPSRTGWGELTLVKCQGDTPAWGEWAGKAVKVIAARWREALERGSLRKIANPSGCYALTAWLQQNWTAPILESAKELAGLHVVDEAEDAAKVCLRQSHRAQQILLVRPPLALELERRGARAGVVNGLPIWSRASLDAPHLDPLIQDLAYEQFGQSVQAELASNPRNKE